MGRALIFSGGTLRDLARVRRVVRPSPADLVLAADAGATHALALGLVPALVVGDMDSTGPGLRAQLQALGVPVRVVPRAKDQTDTHLAVEEALRRGVTELVLIAGSGSRFDHTLANLLLLAGLDPAVRAQAVGDGYTAWWVGPGQGLEVAPEPDCFISLLPLTPVVTGVYARNLRWELAGATLRWGESLGVSNEFRAGPASIRVGTGRLLVVVARE